MNWYFRQIRAKQIGQQLTPLYKIFRPKDGWIRTMRETLGMNTRQLGERCNLSTERIIRIESDELKNKLTMETLEKIAAAMNCKLVYGLVPSDGITEFIETTALNKAVSQLKYVTHTMALEDQKISDKALNEQVLLLRDELLRGNIKKIWDK